MTDFRKEADSLGEVAVPADQLWGAQTQCSLEHFSIGKDLMPREMIGAYAVLKKAAGDANHAGGRLDDRTRANRANQLGGRPLGSKTPVHPNDHVNMSQSSKDEMPCTSRRRSA
jgi:fumarate hydratase, class II